MRFQAYMANAASNRRFNGLVPVLGLIINTAVLLLAGCSLKAPSEPLLEAKGYRTAKSLDGGGYGNSFNLQDKSKVFLVVTVSLQTDQLIPSEAEYKAMKHDNESSKQEAGETNISMPAREYCRIFSPQRFTVILADGRGYHGELIARENSGLMGFSSSCIFWQSFAEKQVPEVPKNETVNVAFVVGENDCRPPFQIQFDRNAAVAVPDTKL